MVTEKALEDKASIRNLINSIEILLGIIGDPCIRTMPIEVLNDGLAVQWTRESLAKLKGD